MTACLSGSSAWHCTAAAAGTPNHVRRTQQLLPASLQLQPADKLHFTITLRKHSCLCLQAYSCRQGQHVKRISNLQQSCLLLPTPQPCLNQILALRPLILPCNMLLKEALAMPGPLAGTSWHCHTPAPAPHATVWWSVAASCLQGV